MPSINWNLLGLSVEDWTIATLVTLSGFLILSNIIRYLSKRLAVITGRTTNKLDDVAVDMLAHTNRFILFLIALLIAFSLLDLPKKWEARIDHGWIIVIGMQVALWLNFGINVWMRSYMDRATTTTIVFLMRLIIWATLLLAILANVGINITAFVTSLGIGGIAVALSLQNILSDLFASLSISLDKPFEIGDFIVVTDLVGTVEYIGVKTTRIRSLSGEQIIISNTELLKRIIHNFKRMAERRALFTFKIRYDTPPTQVAALPDIVKTIIGKIAGTRFDRAHFKQFGDNALEFEVVYYVLNPDYNFYMDVQQQVNLDLMQACSQHQIAFFHPA
ncbi:MAG TPA: mechanosensitive ion channel family protein [Burkholderiaceae bacterium]|jgi:small-conductance mechanosensitive channel